MRRRLTEIDCWDGYGPGAAGGPKTKEGTGKNKGKRVNNCEKKGTKKKKNEVDEVDEYDEIQEAALRSIVRRMLEACYQGKKVELDSPSSASDNPDKKSKVYVSTGDRIKGDGACKGEVKAKKVEFGDPDMKIRKSNPEARSSFRARHKCDQKKDKDTAGYWSCKAW
jgi:hypothetical protein